MKSAKASLVIKNRSFGVIDIENLVGGSDNVNPRICKALQKCLDNLFGNLPIMWVAATGPNAVRNHHLLAFDFPGVRLLRRAGVDGADECLAEVLTEEPASRRSTQIIIVGGDRRMIPCARDLKTNGCRIVIVGRRGSIARGLLEIADEVHYFSPYAQINNSHLEGGI
ncbi:MAG: hypothetical protein NTV13_07115 [Actinobacteria bacterium]|jgi:hypothetical protein|nr:hypothetical protein [Actinomycetota bacterium]